MKRKTRAQLHLPPLDPDDALLVVHVLDRLASAIWRAHGPQMAARLRSRETVHPQPVAAGRIGRSDGQPDDDLPF